MDRVPAVMITLLAGALIAFQPPANAALAQRVGDVGATFTSLVISAVLGCVLLVAAGAVGDLRGLSGVRPEHLLGGLAGAAVVAVSLVTVRTLGAAGVTAALVATQLTTSAVLDRLGVLGLPGTALSGTRLAGITLLVAGTVLVTSR